MDQKSNSFSRIKEAAYEFSVSHVGRQRFTGLSKSAIQALCLATARNLKNEQKIVIILQSEREMGRWLEFFDLCQSIGTLGKLSVAALPACYSWGNDRFADQAPLRRQRVAALAAALDKNEPGLFLTTLAGLGLTTSSPAKFRSGMIALQSDMDCDVSNLCKSLEDIGYHPVNTVNESGEYAQRGGIVDIYAANINKPARLEFLGDQLRAIRLFDPAHQRSQGALKELEIAPAREFVLKGDDVSEAAQRLYDYLLKSGGSSLERDDVVRNILAGRLRPGMEIFYPPLFGERHTFFDYIDLQSTLFLSPEPVDRCLDGYETTLASLDKLATEDRNAGRLVVDPSDHFLNPKAFSDFLYSAAGFAEFGDARADGKIQSYRFALTVNPQLASLKKDESNHVEKFSSFAASTLGRETTIIVLVPDAEQAKRVTQLFDGRKLSAQANEKVFCDFLDGKIIPPGIWVGFGILESSLYFEEDQVAIVPFELIFPQATGVKKRGTGQLRSYLNTFADLKVGGLVVHVEHGIGRYLGIQNMNIAGFESDFIALEYAEGDRVYLPVDRLSMLQRYTASGEGDSKHRLDRLQGNDWQKRKISAKKSVKDIAESLLRAQAGRVLSTAPALSGRGEIYEQFTSEFRFEETDDQWRAIEDTQADLSTQKPMDRLVCGDVGFGKTEVALRSAFRTVLDGFQVVVIAPTTILCFQHYRTFATRMNHHGVRVAQLNRFVSKQEQIETLKLFEAGQVDVLVGTHRLLSNDVKPKSLGLVVVDEEQRFGVVHKEKIKALRMGAHTLTLTATPIPRTLHMAMLGLRDLSIITTPPPNRLPVRVIVASLDEALVRDAINTEVARGGQVFFLHNRVEDIEEIRLYISALCPEARVQLAHGQMHESRLEKVMMDFTEHRFDVLVCSTIIESGIDIPNVNTLMVHNAERFGLAQLYQLKGRVGRSSRQAYAYFFIPPIQQLSNEAQQRIEVLTSFQALGSGFQVASHDLEIRGAGNLIGSEQSGKISDIGLEMYSDMLEEAIAEFRGSDEMSNFKKKTLDPIIKLQVAAQLPASYVQSEYDRLTTYRRFFSAESVEDVHALSKEMIDRFGSYPEPVDLLIELAKLKVILKVLVVEKISPMGSRGVELVLDSFEETKFPALISWVGRNAKTARLTPNKRLQLEGVWQRSEKLHEQKAALEILVAKLESLLVDLS